ncbi:hypothetical protein WG66_001215 [Moniliophthora roreri]|nr:hypothetical protein WG66_001215 [Moniliophthora roreri]
MLGKTKTYDKIHLAVYILLAVADVILLYNNYDVEKLTVIPTLALGAPVNCCTLKADRATRLHYGISATGIDRQRAPHGQTWILGSDAIACHAATCRLGWGSAGQILIFFPNENLKPRKTEKVFMGVRLSPMSGRSGAEDACALPFLGPGLSRDWKQTGRAKQFREASSSTKNSRANAMRQHTNSIFGI